MSPLERQHAAESLSLAEIGWFAAGAVLFFVAWTFIASIVRERRARRRRMDDRKTDAWQREVAARLNHDMTTSTRRRA